MASQITGVLIVYSTVCSSIDHRKHQSSASLTFVKGIHRWPVNSLHKGPGTWKMFPFDAVVMFVFFRSSSTLVQVMAWRHQATRHYQSQYRPRSTSPYGITRPQWVRDTQHRVLSTQPWQAQVPWAKVISCPLELGLKYKFFTPGSKGFIGSSRCNINHDGATFQGV